MSFLSFDDYLNNDLIVREVIKMAIKVKNIKIGTNTIPTHGLNNIRNMGSIKGIFYYNS
jgi:hypothetical protein